MKRIFAALLASLLVAACGGGAQTTENVAGTGNGNGNTSAVKPPYTGPAPRDADVQNFRLEFWENARGTDRCGSCHTPDGGQTPYFVRWDDVNLAYDEATLRIDRDQPSNSEFVTKVSSPPIGHNCWVDTPSTCGSIMTTWIENWIGFAAEGGRQIQLQAPVNKDPSPSINFPDDTVLFEQHLWRNDRLLQYCAGCHSSQAPTPQQPYFADADVNVAYEAVKPKIDLDTPDNSRLVIRVRDEFHNCWNNDCVTSGQEMSAWVNAFVTGIGAPEPIDAALITSQQVGLFDGTVATGGNRYENDQIALWEFQEGVGNVAPDTSGIDPAIDLNFSGDVQWYGGWGITIGNGAQGPGKAQASTVASRKLFDILGESGEFSIEAWVVPANVTQEMRRIVSYSMGQDSRNFTLQQTLYNYDFLLRTNAQDANGNSLTTLNGDPQLSTLDGLEALQATLQHVVATYDPVNGRRIYVNGVLSSDTDPVPGGTFSSWQNNMAFILGNEASSDGVWEGTLRMVAIHRRALSEAQVNQNLEAGVGERFYLLFDISHRIGVTPQTAYIVFEVQQFDSFAYLFDKPHFTTLDGSTPQPVVLEGLRIAMNGREAPVGQSYANLDQTLDLATATLDELGQSLSPLGAVLPLEQGPDTDEFFLTFDNIDGNLYNRPEDPALVETDFMATAEERRSDIGVRTFDEIDATYAFVTGVDRVNYSRLESGQTVFPVEETYQELRQSLPSIADIEGVLSSHQVAIAQLAIQYCDAAVESNTMWTGLDFDTPAGTFFAAGTRDAFVEPLIQRVVGHSSTSLAISSQPSYALVHAELASFISGGAARPDNLIDRLLAGSPPNPPSDTRSIAKGVCASVLGSAATLIQ
ncbi:MAG TPA: LamG domain-containing protein [Woeseiaceae bacterium]|nr:LamG domain-containing protein [Woeseiaceae bacterium]